MTAEQKRQQAYYLEHREHALEIAARYRKTHREELRAKQRALYWKRREQGICTVCGTSPATDGKTKCAVCRAYNLAYQRVSEARRKSNGNRSGDDTRAGGADRADGGNDFRGMDDGEK